MPSRRQIRVELERMPAHDRTRRGFARREHGERRAEPAPADEAPWADDVGHDVDVIRGGRGAHADSGVCDPALCTRAPGSDNRTMRRRDRRHRHAHRPRTPPCPPRAGTSSARVVDNYGDAGVCWRLARQLAAEHALDVTLWHRRPRARWRGSRRAIDRRATAARQQCGRRDACCRLGGAALPAGSSARRRRHRGLRLRPSRRLRRGDGAMRPPPPAWFVLEYLCAEAWVERPHGLPSPHPRLPLPRRFWFPGFTPRHRRAAARARASSRRAMRSGATPPRSGRCGGAPACRRPRTGRTPRVAVLLSEPRRCPRFSTPGPTATRRSPASCRKASRPGALDAWTGGNVPHPGDRVPARRADAARDPVRRAGRLRPAALALPTVNFVRGEDSFVRAQWAARPFAWHVYPQAGRRALAQARRLPRPLRAGLARRRRRRCAGSGGPGTGRPAPGRSAPPGGISLAARPQSGRPCGRLGGAARHAARPRRRAGQGGRDSGIIKSFPNQPLIAIIQVP